jgi:hypothetical protein
MRLRFSLKALLALVALVCIGLAFVVWNKRIVDRRHALLPEIVAQGGGVLVVLQLSEGIWPATSGSMPRDCPNSDLDPSSAAPGPLRSWLGDYPINIIWIPKSVTPALAEEIFRLFPEAHIKDATSKEGRTWKDLQAADLGKWLGTGASPQAERTAHNADERR